MLKIEKKFDISTLTEEITIPKLQQILDYMFLTKLSRENVLTDYFIGESYSHYTDSKDVLHIYKNSYATKVSFNISYDVEEERWVLYNSKNLNSLFKISLDLSKAKYRKVLLKEFNVKVFDYTGEKSPDVLPSITYDKEKFTQEHFFKTIEDIMLKDLKTLVQNQIKKKYKETISDEENAVKLLKQSKITLKEFQAINTISLTKDINEYLESKSHIPTYYNESIALIAPIISKEVLYDLNVRFILKIMSTGYRPDIRDNSEELIAHLVKKYDNSDGGIINHIVVSFNDEAIMFKHIKSFYNLQDMEDRKIIELASLFSSCIGQNDNATNLMHYDTFSLYFKLKEIKEKDL